MSRSNVVEVFHSPGHTSCSTYLGTLPLRTRYPYVRYLIEQAGRTTADAYRTVQDDLLWHAWKCTCLRYGVSMKSGYLYFDQGTGTVVNIKYCNFTGASQFLSWWGRDPAKLLCSQRSSSSLPKLRLQAQASSSINLESQRWHDRAKILSMVTRILIMVQQV